MTEWYFVCDRCDCKWFRSEPASLCPRCGTFRRSTERLIPPWREQVIHEAAAQKATSFVLSRGLKPAKEPELVRALTSFFRDEGRRETL